MGPMPPRLVFAAVDKFGAPRPFVEGDVSLEIQGPGVIVGDNPFNLSESGGAGAIWIKTLPNRTGRIRIEGKHASLGSSSVQMNVQRAAK